MKLAIIATIVLGLAIDQHWARYGQLVVSAAAWVVCAALLARSAPPNRHALLACLVFATAGEVFLSLVDLDFTGKLGLAEDGDRQHVLRADHVVCLREQAEVESRDRDERGQAEEGRASRDPFLNHCGNP